MVNKTGGRHIKSKLEECQTHVKLPLLLFLDTNTYFSHSYLRLRSHSGLVAWSKIEARE